MTNKHKDKLIKRINSDTYLNNCICKSVSTDTKYLIQSLVDKRVFNGITQDYMAKTCKVSIVTIKRFENLQVDSLLLFLDYKFLLEKLPNKKKMKTPKWLLNN